MKNRSCNVDDAQAWWFVRPPRDRQMKREAGRLNGLYGEARDELNKQIIPAPLRSETLEARFPYGRWRPTGPNGPGLRPLQG